MDDLYWLSQIEYVEQSLVGNELYILSQLLRHGVGVVPGFVLGNNLLRRFLTNSAEFTALLQELSVSGSNLDFADHWQLQSVAHRSRQIIKQGVIPEQWQREIWQAAQQLNCQYLCLQPFFTLPYRQNVNSQEFWRSQICLVEKEAIARSIKLVWSELFTARSLLYRQKLGIKGEETNLAILIRPLIKADAGGTVEITEDLIRVKAVWGLPLSLLQGDVEADEYYFDSRTGYMLSRQLGQKNVAYRVKSKIVPHQGEECIETYIPETKQGESYVLERSQLHQLFQDVQKIQQQQPQVKFLVWNGVQDPVSSEEWQFWFTDLREELRTKIHLPSSDDTSVLLSPSNFKPLFTGISAAPGKAIATVMVIKNGAEFPESIPQDVILVTRSLNPEHIPLLKQLKGIITEVGGTTSHAAIIARELKIPAVVNVPGVTAEIGNGDEIFLNGDEGKIYPAQAVKQLSVADAGINSFHAPQPQLIATKLMVNISQRESIADCLNLPIDGLGLLRSELMLGDILRNSSQEQWQSASWGQQFTLDLQEMLREFVTAFNPRPVFYRSLDGMGKRTDNSLLGDRGTYSYRSNFSLFPLELEALAAIVREGYSNLRLILPFVRSVGEFKFCYRQLEALGLTDQESFQVWIMAEVPSVIWLLPEYIRAGVQGIAIGTNDLTQLMLGVEREQVQFSHQGLNANHPAMHKAIAELITIAKDHGIECSICGQAPVEYPSLIEKLVNWGITAISVEPEAVNSTYRAIAKAERQILLNFYQKL